MSNRATSLSVSALLSLAVGVGALTGCSSAQRNTESFAESSSEALTAEALSSNENAAYAFFVNKGLTSAQAAGIVGNLIQESTVLPTAVEPGGPGRGIGQWSTGGRWNTSSKDNVEWYAAEQGLSATSLTLQLDFIWYELENFSAYGLSHLKAATTISAATLAFQDYYEVCGACDETNRLNYAEEVYSEHSSVSGGGSTTSSGECYSSTLGEEVSENACVQSKSNSEWYQCDEGSWVPRASDPSACSSTHAL